MDRLVDILLSLLAYSSAELPSAPLREATEATFKAFAAHLTQTGPPPSHTHTQKRGSSFTLRTCSALIEAFHPAAPYSCPTVHPSRRHDKVGPCWCPLHRGIDSPLHFNCLKITGFDEITDQGTLCPWAGTGPERSNKVP